MTRLDGVAGLVVAFAAVSSALASPAERNHKDDTKAGRDLALIVCSACHVVAPDQRYPVAVTHPVPAFDEIANRPQTTRESLQRFLSGTHWDMLTVPMSMPDLMLMDN